MIGSTYTREAFETDLRALGLSRAAFAKLYGIHVTTASRWGTEGSPYPLWVKVALAYQIASNPT